MTASLVVSLVFLAAAGFFFVAGTVGVLRFPDVYTRLHALTKADNLGLGFVIVALAVRARPMELVELGIIWSLVLVSSAIACQLIAGHALEQGTPVWRAK